MQILNKQPLFIMLDLLLSFFISCTSKVAKLLSQHTDSKTILVWSFFDQVGSSDGLFLTVTKSVITPAIIPIHPHQLKHTSSDCVGNMPKMHLLAVGHTFNVIYVNFFQWMGKKRKKRGCWIVIVQRTCTQVVLSFELNRTCTHLNCCSSVRQKGVPPPPHSA